jgi:hypothetical protein
MRPAALASSRTSSMSSVVRGSCRSQRARCMACVLPLSRKSCGELSRGRNARIALRCWRGSSWAPQRRYCWSRQIWGISASPVPGRLGRPTLCLLRLGACLEKCAGGGWRRCFRGSSEGPYLSSGSDWHRAKRRLQRASCFAGWHSGSFRTHHEAGKVYLADDDMTIQGVARRQCSWWDIRTIRFSSSSSPSVAEIRVAILSRSTVQIPNIRSVMSIDARRGSSRSIFAPRSRLRC